MESEEKMKHWSPALFRSKLGYGKKYNAGDQPGTAKIDDLWRHYKRPASKDVDEPLIMVCVGQPNDGVLDAPITSAKVLFAAKNTFGTSSSGPFPLSTGVLKSLISNTKFLLILAMVLDFVYDWNPQKMGAGVRCLQFLSLVNLLLVENFSRLQWLHYRAEYYPVFCQKGYRHGPGCMMTSLDFKPAEALQMRYLRYLRYAKNNYVCANWYMQHSWTSLWRLIQSTITFWGESLQNAVFL